MLKKISGMIGTMALIMFSFYYTDRAIDIVRKTDPIMKEIVEYSNNYGNTSIDSILVNNNIIPGTKGNAVNIDESYIKMKKLGYFDKNLIVFEEVLPVHSIKNNFDNYIISGNQDKNMTSIIFNIEDVSYIEEILKTINRKNITATFFLPIEIFDNSSDLIKLIMGYGHEVELIDSKYNRNTVNRASSIKKIVAKGTLNFCLVDSENETILKNCKEEKLHTIIPTIKSEKYPYSEVKNNLKNGSIIVLENNKNTVRELSAIINYIEQKGIKIVSLEKLLEE